MFFIPYLAVTYGCVPVFRSPYCSWPVPCGRVGACLGVVSMGISIIPIRRRLINFVLDNFFLDTRLPLCGLKE